jgi:coronin-7
MDFHEDLFPEIFEPRGLDADGWIHGTEQVRPKVSLDPEKQQWRTASTKTNPPQTAGSPSATSKSEETRAVEPKNAPPIETPAETGPTSSHEPEPILSPSPKETATAVQNTSSTKAPSSSSPAKPSRPKPYTRSFLTGVSLHPSTHYTSLPPLPPLPARRLLDATSAALSFPIAGAGGRIVRIPLSNTGRASELETIEFGAAGIVDFEQSPDGEKLAVAGESQVKVWGNGGWGPSMKVEKVVMVGWHPLAEDLLGILCLNEGKTEFRVWDVSREWKSCVLQYSVCRLSPQKLNPGLRI